MSYPYSSHRSKNDTCASTVVTDMKEGLYLSCDDGTAATLLFI